MFDLSATAGTYLLAILLRTGGRLDESLPADPTATVLTCVAAGALQVLFNILFDVYWRNWSFASIEDLVALMKSSLLVTAILLAFNLATREMPIGAVLAGGSLVLFVESGLKLRPRWPQILRAAIGRSRATERVIVVGAGRMGRLLAADLADGGSRYRIACFVDDDRSKIGSYLRGVRVSGTVNDLPELTSLHRPSLVVIAVASASGALIQRVVAKSEGSSAGVRRVSGFGLLGDRAPLRTIGIEELLERPAVQLDTPEAQEYIAGRVVLITGAAGSIGSELSQRVARLLPKNLLLLDTNETGLYWVDRRLDPMCPREILLGDIRDRAWLQSEFRQHRPDVVFHAAAYKHVPLLESAPLQGVSTNVLGTMNVLACAEDVGVDRLVLISTDKAVESTNVLGHTKRLAELLVIARARATGKRYAVVRFGNVLGSSGSAIPTFTEQIDRGGPVTVTHAEATRYCMTGDEATSLVIEAGAIARSGDLLVLDMGDPVVILELARKMIRLQGFRTPGDIEIEFVGLRAGEKLHEKLFFDHERPVGTEHPRVLRVTDAGSVALSSLELLVDELRDCMTRQDGAGARQLLLRALHDGGQAAPRESPHARTGPSPRLV